MKISKLICPECDSDNISVTLEKETNPEITQTIDSWAAEPYWGTSERDGYVKTKYTATCLNCGYKKTKVI